MARRPTQHAPGPRALSPGRYHMTVSSGCCIEPAAPVYRQPEADAAINSCVLGAEVRCRFLSSSVFFFRFLIL